MIMSKQLSNTKQLLEGMNIMNWKRTKETKPQTEKEDISWFVIHDSVEEASLIHEETDEDYVVGTFLVKNILSEMGSKIGTITSPHRYAVVIRSNEGMTPHFHVYDKEGRNSKGRKGTHACVQITKNMYFKHGCHKDELDANTRDALDSFMREMRTEDSHSSGIGLTNFVHTINEWNEQNGLKKGMPNWIDKNITTKPDYTTIMDNL